MLTIILINITARALDICVFRYDHTLVFIRKQFNSIFQRTDYMCLQSLWRSCTFKDHCQHNTTCNRQGKSE